MAGQKAGRSLLAAAMLALLLAGAFATRPALAHPHGWIDVTVEVRFDPQGQVTGLYQTWLFDEGYTAFSTQGLDMDGDGRPDQDQLEALLQENIGNLRDYGYFTRVRQHGETLPVATATELTTRMVGDRLEIGFLVPLEAPATPRAAAIDYAIYDPSYFIEMVHAEAPEPIRLSGAPEGCGHRLLPPNPTAEQVALAAALDVDETAQDGLGALFAERVLISCGD